MKKINNIIKFLPNLVTIIGLVIGVNSIRFALDQKWDCAVYCTILAAIIDGMDGKIARMLNATSIFGAELDSLSDLVNFGLCPAILLYLWLNSCEYQIISWICVMLFIVCIALRLARFNSQAIHKKFTKAVAEKGDISFLVGIPAPTGALLVLVPIMINLISFDLRITSNDYVLYIDFYISVIALLCASRIPTFSSNYLYFRSKFVFLILSVLIVCLLVTYPWYAMPLIGLLYLLSLPLSIYLKSKK